MKIGGFWGLPAPMLMIANEMDGRVMDALQLLKGSANRRILYDLKVELTMLSKLSRLVQATFREEELTAFSSQQIVGARVSGNSITGVDDSDGLIYHSFLCEFITRLAKRIAEGEVNGDFVRLPEGNTRQALATVANQFLANEDFIASLLSSKVKACYKALLTASADGGKSYTDQFVDDFGMVTTLPESVRLHGALHTFSDVERKILNKYLEVLPRVTECLNKIQLAESNDLLVFDISFFHLIEKDPKKLRYLVFKRFEYVKDKHSSAALLHAIQDVAEEIAKFRRYRATYTAVYNEVEVADILRQEEFDAKLQEFPSKKRNFFRMLERTEKLHVTDLLQRDFEMLSVLYDVIEALTVSNLNEFFGIDSFSLSDWEEILPQLCELGVCGINFHSLDLFGESISTISMISSNKVMLSAESKEATDLVLCDIDALLATLIPIGEVIK